MSIRDEMYEEAEKLKKIPRSEQLAVLALHKSVADNPKVPVAERKAARQKVIALERILNLKKRRRS